MAWAESESESTPADESSEVSEADESSEPTPSGESREEIAQAASEENTGKYPACTAPPSETDVSAAKGAYRAGQVSFQEGDYDRATLYWEDAFRRDCTAIKLLLNIARAYELSAEWSSAITALSTYLERDPDASDRETVEKRIAKLEEKLAEEQAALAAAAARAAPEDEPEEESAPPPPPPSRPAWPVIVTGTGAALAIGGVTVMMLGIGDMNDEKDAIAEEYRCQRDWYKWDCPASTIDDARQAVKNSDAIKKAEIMRAAGIAGLSAGLVAAGVGTYFWVKLWRRPTQARLIEGLQVAPVFTPKFQGVTWVGSF